MVKNNKEKETKESKTKEETGNENEQHITEYIDGLKRLQADFENYVKNVEREKKEFVKYANSQLLGSLLHVVDSFEKMSCVVKDSNIDKELKEGIEIVFKEFKKVLENEGLKTLEAAGAKFDPFIHEAVEEVEAEGNDCKEGMIVGELQKGYMFKDKLLRPSKVKITKIKV